MIKENRMTVNYFLTLDIKLCYEKNLTTVGNPDNIVGYP